MSRTDATVGCTMAFGDARRSSKSCRLRLVLAFAAVVWVFVGVIGSSMVRAELVPSASLAADTPQALLIELSSEPDSGSDQSYLDHGSSALWHTFASVALQRGRLATWVRSVSPLPWESSLVSLPGVNWRPSGANRPSAATLVAGRDLLTRFCVARC
jgi:hypothetical protein